MASTGKTMTKACMLERGGVYIKIAQHILMKALDPVMSLNSFIYIKVCINVILNTLSGKKRINKWKNQQTSFLNLAFVNMLCWWLWTTPWFMSKSHKLCAKYEYVVSSQTHLPKVVFLTTPIDTHNGLLNWT